MPIVVTYDDLNALGGAALAAGNATGMAQGQADYRQRQHADTQMLMQNAFNRHSQDREYQLRGNEAERQRAFSAEQANLDRSQQVERDVFQTGVENQQRAQEQQFRLGLEREQTQQQVIQDERNYQQDLGRDKYRSELETEQINQRESQRVNREIEQLSVALQASQGLTPEVARQQAGQIIQQQEIARYAGKSGAGEKSMVQERFGTLSGRALQTAYLAARDGRYEQIFRAAEALIDPSTAGMDRADMETGISLAIQDKDIGTITAELNSGMTPQPIKYMLQQELARRGAMNYQSNQITQPARAAPGNAPSVVPSQGSTLSPQEEAERQYLLQQLQGR